MKRLLCSCAMALLCACTPAAVRTPPKSVVILGNKTLPSKCTCPSKADYEREHERAEHWKAYAKKLETQLGIED